MSVPELNVAIFAFLLNFVWEFWQAPFYATMMEAPHWEAVKSCSLATLGDVALMLLGFWTVALFTRSRAWILHSSGLETFGFVLTGVVLTILAEWVGVRVLDRWAYNERMPRLPLLGTGVVPLLQWIVLPPLVVWFVRRQLT